MVRNPMYLGRFFILLGFLMLLDQWWLLLAYTVIYWLYMDARVQREEAHLRADLRRALRTVLRHRAPLRAAAGRRPAPAARLLELAAVRSRTMPGATCSPRLLAWAVVAAWTIWGVPALPH
jgi:hypothetical protein